MHAIRCEGSPKIFGLNVLPYETALQGLPNRTEGNCNMNKTIYNDILGIYEIIGYRSSKMNNELISECLLENIGKPVFHRYTQDLYGSWMQVTFLHLGLLYKK